MLRIGERDCYVFRKFQFNKDYNNRPFRITAPSSKQTRRTYFIVAQQQLLYGSKHPLLIISKTTFFEAISMLLHGTLTLICLFMFYKNSTNTNFEIFTVQHFTLPKHHAADSSWRAVEGVGLRPLVCSDCGLSNISHCDKLIPRPEYPL